MKLLHTSDWHLGRALYGRKRANEFASFLDWLAKIFHEEQVDLLCIDIFDSTNPSNMAQHLYYAFLQNNLQFHTPMFFIFNCLPLQVTASCIPLLQAIDSLRTTNDATTKHFLFNHIKTLGYNHYGRLRSIYYSPNYDW